MINWLRRWFKGERATPLRGPTGAPASAPASASTTTSAASFARSGSAGLDDSNGGVTPDLALLFYRFVAGSPTVTPADKLAPATERHLLDELARLVESPSEGAALVPRVPAVIPQLLKSLRDEAMSGAALSRLLAQDVVLVAAVIREANSPYYSPSAPLSTIESAVMLVGTNGMRMLLARVAFRPIINMQGGRFAQHGAPALWRQSELCALAASQLAPGAGVNPFEAYLAGLLHNIGLVVALRLFDRIYSDEHLPAAAQFAAELQADARCLSARIATLWDFPPGVAGAILASGTTSGSHGATPLAQVLGSAERLAMLCVLFDAGVLDAASVGQIIASVAPGGAELAVFDLLLAEQQKRRP